MAANSWEEKNGEQILLEKNWEQNGERILLERNFLGRKFRGACFRGEDSFGEEILPANFFEDFLRVKCHSGEEKNTGKQKCFGGKRYEEQKFLRVNCYL